MGGRLATYEDSGKVFLRRKFSSVRGRSNSALQELDSSPLLPGSESRRDSNFRDTDSSSSIGFSADYSGTGLDLPAKKYDPWEDE